MRTMNGVTLARSRAIMSSINLFVFCLPNELSEWIVLMSRRYNLEILSYSLKKNKPTVYNSSTFTEISSDSFRIFLCPYGASENRKNNFDKINREWGWIQIKPGHLIKNRQNILLMTEIHATDSAKEPTKLVKCIKWLKKNAAEQIIFGVTGENIALGGKSYYKNICFTKMAEQTMTLETIWKQQLADRSIFTPGNTTLRTDPNF